MKSNLNYEYVFTQLVKYVGDYCIKNDINSTILGISGGIDSTVVAAILRQVAIDYKIDFYGYSLPTKTTDKEEQTVANLVGSNFCTHFEEHVLDEVSNHIGQKLLHKHLGIVETILLPAQIRRFGNIKSRLRMLYLYDFAARNKGIVIGTDNYTEYLLGFSTIGGDALYDLCPIKYLWKTEVYKLANWLIKHYLDADELDLMYTIYRSKRLIPQDGLGISKSDFEQFGVNSYQEVDTILYNFINNLPRTCEVGKVIDLYLKNSFKRTHPIDVSRDVYAESGLVR